MSLTDRLRKGASLLGDLWRGGDRCDSGWSASCSCDPKLKFCRAKEQWIALANDDRPIEMAGMDPSSSLFVIEAMKASELHASGLTMELENGIKIGPKGMASVIDASYVVDAPEAAPSVLKILASFPGAMVVKSEEA